MAADFRSTTAATITATMAATIGATISAIAATATSGITTRTTVYHRSTSSFVFTVSMGILPFTLLITTCTHHSNFFLCFEIWPRSVFNSDINFTFLIVCDCSLLLHSPTFWRSVTIVFFNFTISALL